MGRILIYCVLMAVCPHTIIMYKQRGNKQHTGTAADILTPGKTWTVKTGTSGNIRTPVSKSWDVPSPAVHTGSPGDIMTLRSNSWELPSSTVHAGHSGDIMTPGSKSWDVPSTAVTSQRDIKSTTFPASLMNNFGKTVDFSFDRGSTLFDQGQKVSSNLLDSAERGSGASQKQGFGFAQEHFPITSQLSHDVFLTGQEQTSLPVFSNSVERKNTFSQQPFVSGQTSVSSPDNLFFNQRKKAKTNSNILDSTERSGQTGGFDQNNFMSSFSNDKQITFDNKQSNFLDTTLMSDLQSLLSPAFMFQPHQMALTPSSMPSNDLKKSSIMNIRNPGFQSRQQTHKCQDHHKRPWLVMPMMPQSMPLKNRIGHFGTWTTGGASTDTWTSGSETGSGHTGGVSNGGSAEGD